MLGRRKRSALIGLGIAIAVASSSYAIDCETPQPPQPPIAEVTQSERPSGLWLRLWRFAEVGARHRMTGLASYYSSSLDGTLTATGSIFRNRKLTAAHLTLPLGTWVEIRSRATKKRVTCLVNDRGPYSKFTIDLSQAAARAIGVDRAEDRTVDIRILALPGERPLRMDRHGLALAESEEVVPDVVAK